MFARSAAQNNVEVSLHFIELFVRIFLVSDNLVLKLIKILCDYSVINRLPKRSHDRAERLG